MRNQNVPDAFKSKGGGGILNTNKETGASAWNYSENKFHPSQPGQKFDMRAYNQQALKNAQQKGGGILNTNAESGYDLWHHSGPVKQNPTNFNYEEFNSILYKITNGTYSHYYKFYSYLKHFYVQLLNHQNFYFHILNI